MGTFLMFKQKEQLDGTGATGKSNKLYTSCATNRFFLFMSVQKLNNHKRVMVSHNTLAEASCESKYSFGFFLIPIFPESQLH